ARGGGNGRPVLAGFLPDRVHFLQKDPRWARDTLGDTGDTIARYGCVVTSVAIALANLGFDTDPGDLNRRLSETDNYTPRGWLKWKGVGEVTNGKAEATFHSEVNAGLIRDSLAAGEYPLVRFILPNGRSHWAVILGQSERGYHMRDPLRDTNSPLIFPRDASAFKALRTIGLA
ncbi:MAG: hypothetical protein WBF53_07400, partial [Litorimonas sp.]